LHIPSQVVARGNRSVAEVLCSIDSPQRNLLPNVNVDVEFMTDGGSPVPSLPRSAVFQEGKEHYTWIIRNGHAVKHSVDTGRSSPGVIEIRQGLKVGDRVIVMGDFPITEGMKVQVAER